MSWIGERKKLKKEKWINILIWGGLAILVLAVVVTSIILHYKNKKLKDLKDKNEIVQPAKQEKIPTNLENQKIFFKNFAIFIDKDLNFWYD